MVQMRTPPGRKTLRRRSQYEYPGIGRVLDDFRKKDEVESGVKGGSDLHKFQ